MIKLQNHVDGGVQEDTLHNATDTEGNARSVCKGSIVRLDGPERGTPTLSQRVAEARDFITQYYESSKREDSTEHMNRLLEVEGCMKETGTYQHTTQELEFGARQAWRNAARCIGRIYWKNPKNLKTFDARHVETAADMFECMKEHLAYATNGGNIQLAITIFPPKQNGKEFRVWNPQFMQYAGYKKDGTIIGDPNNVELTQVLQSLGWRGKGTRFDILPLLLQANSEDPEWFELPPELCLEVHLRHPDYPWFKDLGLKWYALPSLTDMRLEMGGLEYTCAPFSVWYMVTEIGARDLCDEQRYDMLPTIGKMMGLNTDCLSSLWKDRAIVEVNVAVIHSYQMDRVTISDHHTMSESFMQHMALEMAARGGCPADWVWIVPPISGSACPVFHQEMVRYSVRPSFVYQPKAWTTDRFGMPCLPGKVKQKIRLSFEKLAQCIMALLSLKKGTLQRTTAWPHITILYATETGRSLVYSRQVAKTLKRNKCVPKVMCMEDYDINKLQQQENLLVITSTFGTGDPPENGRKFWSSIEEMKRPPNLENMVYAVLALGSTLYPNFCQFGKDVDNFLSKNGAYPICTIHEADEMKGQESVLRKWSKTVVEFFTKAEVEESKAIYRCVFDKDGQATSSGKILNELHNTDTKLLEVKYVKELQAQGTIPKYFDVQFSGEHIQENIDFEPGDHLQIHPTNQIKHINMVLSKLRVAPEQYNEPVALQVYDSDAKTWSPDERFPEALTLTQALTWFLDLMAPASDEFLEAIQDPERLRRNNAMGTHNNNSADLVNMGKKEAITNGTEDTKDNMPLSYLEVIHKVKPQSIPPEVLLCNVTTIKPRKYSLSTAPLYDKKPVYNVTFKEIVYSRNGTAFKGLATGFMSALSVGQTAYVSLSVAHTFRLAMAASRPSLMIAQGTGISPFRAFWRHKLALHQNPQIYKVEPGELHLYYGCRNQDIDFLYKKEILAMKERGVLRHVNMAYSRGASIPKTYVQHLLTQNAEQLGKLIYEDHGYVFYCGDISNWDEICNLLGTVLQETAALSEEQAKYYIKLMMQENRLTRDIFME